jgi:MSHA biogenesis protein MshL
MKIAMLGSSFLMATLVACASVADRKANMAEIQRDVATTVAPTPTDAEIKNALLPPLAVAQPQVMIAPLSPRFDLIVSNAPVQQVLMGMVADTPYNMLVHPEIKGNVSLQLKNVTVPEAMMAIRDLYGYDYRIEGNLITVMAPGLRTRIFQVNYPNALRNGESEVRVISGSLTDNTTTTGASAGAGTSTTTGNTVVNSSHVKTTSKSNFWQDLTSTLALLVPASEGRSVVINPEANVVVVRAMPEEMHAVEEYLRVVQGTVVRQITLEAKILEVQLNDGFQSGINWNVLGRNKGRAFGVGSGVNTNALTYPGVGVNNSSGNLSTALGNGLNAAQGLTSGGLFALSVQASDFSAILQILGSQGSIEVLSSPRIATINNQQAVLKVGTDEFYVTGVTSNNTSNGTTTTYSPSFTTQPFFSGVALDVTPQIDGDGNVILHIHPSVSDVSTATTQIDLGAAGTFSLPLASSSIKETDSIVRARLGQVIAIGGLMSRNTSRTRNEIPGLGSIPLLGNLFSNDSQSSSKEELVILLKASLSDEDSTPAQLGTRLLDIAASPH